MKLLSYHQITQAKGVNYCRTHLARLAKSGKFPQPVVLSTGRVLWVESEVDTWIAEHVAARNAREPVIVEM